MRVCFSGCVNWYGIRYCIPLLILFENHFDFLLWPIPGKVDHCNQSQQPTPIPTSTPTSTNTSLTQSLNPNPKPTNQPTTTTATKPPTPTITTPRKMTYLLICLSHLLRVRNSSLTAEELAEPTVESWARPPTPPHPSPPLFGEAR